MQGRGGSACVTFLFSGKRLKNGVKAGNRGRGLGRCVTKLYGGVARDE